MTSRLSSAEAARQAAIEAARRAAIAAAKKAAEEAAKKAAAEAAKKQAAQVATQAAAKAEKKVGAPLKKPLGFGRDELSTGKGSALRKKGAAVAGSGLAPEVLNASGKKFSLNEILNAQKAGTAVGGSSLATEVRGDGKANCLENAANLAKPGDSVVLLNDTKDPVGHAVVQKKDGSVIDPNDPEKPYESLEAFQAANPNYTEPATVKDADVEKLLSTKPGPARDALIQELGLQAVAQRTVADSAGTSSTDQAVADAANVERAYDDAIAAGENPAEAAKRASEELASLAEAHAGDPAYVNKLLEESSATLDQIAATIGANSEGDFDGDTDKGRIKDTLKNLARVAEAGGSVTAATIGHTLAGHIDDDGELMHVDDAFYELQDDGGSTLLFEALGSALAAQGKNEAAQELVERGSPSLLERATDFAGDVVGAVTDAAGNVVGFATDLGENVLSVARDGVEFAVDVAENTVDLVGDAASWTKDQVQGAVEYAVEQGLRLAGPVLDKVRDLAREGIDAGLGISENVQSLEPGDELSLGGSIEVQLGVQVEASADIKVSMELGDDGQPVYTVSGEVEAGVGIGAGGTGTAGVGGKMEFTFDNPEDAAKAAKILAAGAAGVAALAGGATAVLAPALLPSPDDLAFLNQNLASVEVSASVGAEFETAAGAAQAEIEGEQSYRINFEDGKPVSMTRTTTASVSGSAGGPLEVLSDSLGNAVNLPGGVNASGSIAVETTIPIDGSGVTDVAAFLASPATAAFAGEATTSITISGEFAAAAGNEVGVSGEIKIDDIDAAEARQVLGAVTNGNFRQALRGVDVEISGSANTFADEGLDVEVDATVAGQGVTIAAHNEIRRNTGEVDFEVQLG